MCICEFRLGEIVVDSHFSKSSSDRIIHLINKSSKNGVGSNMDGLERVMKRG